MTRVGLAGVELGAVELSAYELPAEQPSVPATTYLQRMAAAERATAEAGLDALIVYADREHFANLCYLTGYDPRFEESLLLLVPGRAPTLLVGNEGAAYAKVVPPAVEVLLYQTLSLVGQDRSASPPLANILRGAGIGRGGPPGPGRRRAAVRAAPCLPPTARRTGARRSSWTGRATRRSGPTW